MAWRPPGDKPLSESMMVSLVTYIGATRPRWVKVPNIHLWYWQLKLEWYLFIKFHRNTYIHLWKGKCQIKNICFKALSKFFFHAARLLILVNQNSRRLVSDKNYHGPWVQMVHLWTESMLVAPSLNKQMLSRRGLLHCGRDKMAYLFHANSASAISWKTSPQFSTCFNVCRISMLKISIKHLKWYRGCRVLWNLSNQ